jgi:hypothetical protein
MKSLVENNWSVEIFWFPYNSLSVFDYEPKNDYIWVRAINKVKNPKSVDLAEFSYYSWKDAKDSLTQEALQVVAPIIASNPGLSKTLRELYGNQRISTDQLFSTRLFILAGLKKRSSKS